MAKNWKEIYYPESAFGGNSQVDGTVAFYSRVQFLTQPDSTVLDVGCGRGQAAEKFDCKPSETIRKLRGKCHRVIGIDIDSAGQENPLIDEFRLIDNSCWPVKNSSIDLLYADFVLEHIEQPQEFFAECSRVVKPGGYACFRTPNLWSYVALASKMIPNRYHSRALKELQAGRKEEDIFPTYYRANSKGRLKDLLRNNGFDGCVLYHIGEPSYLGFSRWAYSFGVFMHRWMPSLFKTSLFVFAKREP